ncbi:DUF3991 and toprim domain-containing protein [Wolinella succinogenes]|uniref:DUF3991 and toprim domain-containing protein n=1 Tax=Wolinella succinogenes TaxID=844 RepID=UPI002FC6EC5D
MSFEEILKSEALKLEIERLKEEFVSIEKFNEHLKISIIESETKIRVILPDGRIFGHNYQKTLEELGNAREYIESGTWRREVIRRVGEILERERKDTRRDGRLDHPREGEQRRDRSTASTDEELQARARFRRDRSAALRGDAGSSGISTREQQRAISAYGDSQRSPQKSDVNPLSIPLNELLALAGYEPKRDKTSRNNVVMRGGDGDNLVISRMPDDHYLYFNANNDSDRGTIFDFCRNRGISARDLIGAYERGGGEIQHSIERTGTSRTPANLKKIQDTWNALPPYAKSEDTYLEKVRKLSRETIALYSEIKIDERKNICFPSYALDEKSGYIMIVGYNKRLQSPLTKDKEGKPYEKPIKALHSGEKGLEILKSTGLKQSNIKTLVIGESSIDMLSLVEMKKIDPFSSLLVATGGQLNESAQKLLGELSRRYPNAELIRAPDNDRDGIRMTEKIAGILQRESVELFPQLKDHNDDLKALKILNQASSDLRSELSNELSQTIRAARDQNHNHNKLLQKINEITKLISPDRLQLQAINQLQQNQIEKGGRER